MTKDNDLIENLSNNLIYYRKVNNLTQLELAVKIDYSDKSISKWERGEGLPDLLVLSQLSKLYNITINDLIGNKKHYKPSSNKKHLLITIISAGLPWLIATIIFVLSKLIFKDFSKTWLVFIYTIPVSAIILIVFSTLWGTKISIILSLSVLYWSVPLAIYLSSTTENMYLFFYIAIPIQIITFLWFIMISYSKKK